MSKSLVDREFERILLIKPSSLGDVIHALPVLRGLRRRFPVAIIDWLIHPAFAPLIEGHPDLSGVIRFERNRYAKMLHERSAVSAFLAFIRSLRHRRYDLAIDLQGLFRSGFLARACGAKTRIGFRKAREGSSLFYTHFIDPPSHLEHAVDRNVALGGLLGFGAAPVEFPIVLSDRAVEEAKTLLSERRVPDHHRIVLIAPGGRWETKLWPVSRFVELIRALSLEHDLRCILVGGADDRPRCDQIANGMGTVAINLAGSTDLPTLVALISLSSLVVCHDSGPMHIAAALGRPLICISGPTNPLRTGPYRRMHDVVRLDLPCSPCYIRKLSACPHQHRCMIDLDVQTVLEQARNRLAAHGVRVGATS